LEPQSKPYDRLLKSLGDDDPRSLLHLLGIVPNSEDSTVETLPRAASPPLLEVDHLYAVGGGIKKRLVHLEFQTHYRRDLPDRLTRYVLSLHLQYGLPVQCVPVLLVARHAPVEIPSDCEMQFGGLSVRLEYQVVRLWEISGREALDMNEARILPLIPLLQVSTEDLQEAARMRILTEAMLKESSFYQMILEEGMEKGSTGLRNAIREVVSSRFPGPADLAGLDQIKDIDRLQQILTVALRAQNLTEVTAAI